MKFFILLIQILFVPAISPLCLGIIKKLKAKFQNRQGASIFQPYNDLRKLFNKDEIISKDASWIFKIAPYIIFTITLIIGASIPQFTSFLINNYTGDLLFTIYALAIGTFFLALAGMDIGSAFGGFGSSREMTVSALAEGGFVFSLLTVALINGTSNLTKIPAADILSHKQFLLSLALAFVGFVLVMLAETCRFPYDNPATHLELTMIHEAMILEYSGKKLALLEWASANKLVIFAILGANLFFPFGIAQTATLGALAIGIVALLLKILFFCFMIAFIESTIAKYRFFRLPGFLMLSFILNIVAIGLIYLI